MQHKKMENNPGTNQTTKPASNPDVFPYQPLDISKLAIAAAKIGTWFIDESNQTFVTSARTKELYGYFPEEEMSFEEALTQIPPKFRKKVIRSMKTATSQNEAFYLEYPVIGFHDQQQRWLRVMGGSDQPATGSMHFSGVVMDITESKQNELRRNRFIGMVSHELKTPLTALKAYIQLLNKWAKKTKDGFTIGALSKLEKQVKKMTTMINGFLNFSGVESGKIHLNKLNFEVMELLKEVVEEYSDISPDHLISLSACEEITVHADREKIEQVVINLISNAIKYSDPGKPVEVSCLQEQARLVLSVKDTGMGIDQKDIDKLFKPHSRIKTIQTENISGFGIGLYLCAEIVKYHGGEIGVKSEAGKGSTFWFSLPLTDPSDTENSDQSKQLNTGTDSIRNELIPN